MNTLLEIENLTISIEDNGQTYPAVKTISFSIDKGEIVGLVGESGCGKSLTALSLEELLSPGVQKTGGTIKFDGRNMSLLKEKERRSIYGRDISMIFQEPMTSLNPLIKIWKQVGENLNIHTNLSKRQIKQRVAEVLVAVGFKNPEEIMEMYPHQLSGGMRQRAMIASAAICNPKLLIADEPTTALDALTQEHVIELLKKINKEYHTAILFISHDLNLIKKLCTKTLVMYAGKIIEQGKTEDILNNPLHPYTKGLLGSMPTKEKKGQELPSIPGKVPAVTDTHYPCSFAPRCKNATTICFTEEPVEKDVSENHSAKCHFCK